MMAQVIDGGTGTRAQLPGGRPAAGKTGTTQAARDAWFVGFTADYVVGVWMGYDDNTPLSGVSGGGMPADIWREVTARAEEGLPVRALPARTPAPPIAQMRPPAAGNPVASVEQAVRSVVGNVLNGLFGRN
jgi:penicillin-binding protein 1A